MKMNRTIIDALNNDPATYKELCGLLDINDGWRQLLAAVTEGIYGVSDVEREKYALQHLYSNGSPTQKLLAYWSTRGMSLERLCQALEQLKFERPLMLLKTPEPLQIVQQPPKQTTVRKGDSLKLSCSATGFPYPRYTWFCGKVEIDSSLVTVRGELHIKEMCEHHLGKGVFICRVHNSLSLTANDVRWTNWCHVEMLPNSFSCSCHIVGLQKPSFVHETGAPDIKVQPSDYSINLNAKATFAVVATGMKPLHYKWFHNGQVIEGEKGEELIVVSDKTSKQGTYQCKVSNSKGEVLSEIKRLDIKPVSGQYTAKDKVALVMGNVSYKGSGELPAVSNDVRSMTRVLRKLGFKVVSLLDVSLEEMNAFIDLFCSLLVEGVYAVFYCSGHGFVSDGHHYLLPWDCHVGGPDAVASTSDECLCIEDVEKKIQQRNPDLCLMIIDFCRRERLNEHYAKPTALGTVGPCAPSLTSKQGNTVLMCAASYNEDASESDKSGLFTDAFVKVLETSSEPLTVFQIHERVLHEMELSRLNNTPIQNPVIMTNLKELRRTLTDKIENNLKKVDGSADRWRQVTTVPPNTQPLIAPGMMPFHLSFSEITSNRLSMEIRGDPSVHITFPDSNWILNKKHFRILRNGSCDIYEIYDLQKLKQPLTLELVCYNSVSRVQVQVHLNYPLVSALNAEKLRRAPTEHDVGEC